MQAGTQRQAVRAWAVAVLFGSLESGPELWRQPDFGVVRSGPGATEKTMTGTSRSTSTNFTDEA